jgi:hypothetical protein
MGIPLLEGRLWDEGFWTDPVEQWGPQKVVISEGMARKAWPGESAVGKFYLTLRQDPDVVSQSIDVWRRLQPGDPWPEDPQPREVIGVVADASMALGQQGTPSIYVPFFPLSSNLFIRTAAVDPAGSLAVLRREIDAIDPNEFQVERIVTMEQFFAEGSEDSRFRAMLVVFFAVVATGITCLGLFGVLAYVVALRTRELGIRMTLGAARSDIAGLVLRQGVRMTGLGVVLGLVLVFFSTRYISSLLFGVAPLDLTTLVGVAALIFALALVASYLPARRAMSVDPIESLREG